jgi:phosphoglycolate phosphatase-like HAD superfamily hydrolase
MNEYKSPNFKLFWDVDGTLLRTNGAAAKPYAFAASKLIGKEITIDRKLMSGLTDYEIARKLFESSNKQIDLNKISRMLDEYCELLPKSLELGTVEKVGKISETLEMLLGIKTIKVSIGTGNCLTGLSIKLSRVKLLQFFDLDDAYYASEINWSRELIMEQAFNSLNLNQVGIVIGDSPRDIEVAKKSNLKVIAVTSGAHTKNELIVHGPDAILDGDWGLNELLKVLKGIALYL